MCHSVEKLASNRCRHHAPISWLWTAVLLQLLLREALRHLFAIAKRVKSLRVRARAAADRERQDVCRVGNLNTTVVGNSTPSSRRYLEQQPFARVNADKVSVGTKDTVRANPRLNEANTLSCRRPPLFLVWRCDLRLIPITFVLEGKLNPADRTALTVSRIFELAT